MKQTIVVVISFFVFCLRCFFESWKMMFTSENCSFAVRVFLFLTTPSSSWFSFCQQRSIYWLWHDLLLIHIDKTKKAKEPRIEQKENHDESWKKTTNELLFRGNIFLPFLLSHFGAISCGTVVFCIRIERTPICMTDSCWSSSQDIRSRTLGISLPSIMPLVQMYSSSFECILSSCVSIYLSLASHLLRKWPSSVTQCLSLVLTDVDQSENTRYSCWWSLLCSQCLPSITHFLWDWAILLFRVCLMETFLNAFLFQQ
jgi:hypothetical protein